MFASFLRQKLRSPTVQRSTVEGGGGGGSCLWHFLNSPFKAGTVYNVGCGVDILQPLLTLTTMGHAQ